MSIRDVEAPERPGSEPDAPDTPFILPPETLPEEEPEPEPEPDPAR